MEINLFIARKRFFKTWIFGFVVIFMTFFLIQIFGTRYLNKNAEAWEWFLPNIIPTISLIIGSIVGDWNDVTSKQNVIDKGLFSWTLGLSILYLGVLYVVMFAAASPRDNIIEIYKGYNVVLFPLQGIVSALIGIFFSKAKG